MLLNKWQRIQHYLHGCLQALFCVVGVMFAPCLLQLENLDALGRDRDGHAEGEYIAPAQLLSHL